MVVISPILSSVDHFETLQQLVGLEAEVTKFNPIRENGHLEGRITEIGSPEGRKNFTEEMRIRMGRNYLDFKVHSYFVDDSIRGKISVSGYWDNGSKVLHITAYTGNSQ